MAHGEAKYLADKRRRDAKARVGKRRKRRQEKRTRKTTPKFSL